jgi:hypothetical protein
VNVKLSSELHLRVFESSVIKDKIVGEIFLPLKDDITPILQAEAGINHHSHHNPELESFANAFTAKSKEGIHNKHGHEYEHEHGRGIYNKDSHGNIIQNEKPNINYLCGVREDKVKWYLLYAKDTGNGMNEIVGEIQVAMRLE